MEYRVTQRTIGGTERLEIFCDLDMAIAAFIDGTVSAQTARMDLEKRAAEGEDWQGMTLRETADAIRSGNWITPEMRQRMRTKEWQGWL